MSGIKHASVGQIITEAEWEADNIHIIESGTSFPGSPTEKDLYYRTDEHKWYIYNGTEWRELTAVGIDISDADAAVGDVKSPKTFYSVATPKKTGTMPTVAIVAANDTYSAGYHAGDAGGLDAIDVHLAPANIKTGVNIFGKVGTYTGPAKSAEALSVTLCVVDGFYASEAGGFIAQTYISPAAEITFITKTDTFTAGSLAIASYAAIMMGRQTSRTKMKLYMGGVLVAESGYLLLNTPTNVTLISSRALSGSQIVMARAKNYHGSLNAQFYWYTAEDNEDHTHAFLTVGCVKT